MSIFISNHLPKDTMGIGLRVFGVGIAVQKVLAGKSELCIELRRKASCALDLATANGLI